MSNKELSPSPPLTLADAVQRLDEGESPLLPDGTINPGHPMAEALILVLGTLTDTSNSELHLQVAYAALGKALVKMRPGYRHCGSLIVEVGSSLHKLSLPDNPSYLSAKQKVSPSERESTASGTQFPDSWTKVVRPDPSRPDVKGKPTKDVLVTKVDEAKRFPEDATDSVKALLATQALAQNVLYLTSAWEVCGTSLSTMMVHGHFGVVALHELDTSTIPDDPLSGLLLLVETTPEHANTTTTLHQLLKANWADVAHLPFDVFRAYDDVGQPVEATDPLDSFQPSTVQRIWECFDASLRLAMAIDWTQPLKRFAAPTPAAQGFVNALRQSSHLEWKPKSEAAGYVADVKRKAQVGLGGSGGSAGPGAGSGSGSGGGGGGGDCGDRPSPSKRAKTDAPSGKRAQGQDGATALPTVGENSPCPSSRDSPLGKNDSSSRLTLPDTTASQVQAWVQSEQSAERPSPPPPDAASYDDKFTLDLPVLLVSTPQMREYMRLRMLPPPATVS